MPKQVIGVNLTTNLGTPIGSQTGGGGGGGTGGGGTGGAPSVILIDYNYSAAYRYNSLPATEQLAKIRAEEKDLASVAHLAREINAARLTKLTKPRITAWRAENIKYLKRGGKQ